MATKTARKTARKTAKPKSPPKPKLAYASSSDRKVAQLKGTDRPPALLAPSTCPRCGGQAKKVKAVNEDGDDLFLGVIVDGCQMDIEDDGLKAYQCKTCEGRFFVPS